MWLFWQTCSSSYYHPVVISSDVFGSDTEVSSAYTSAYYTCWHDTLFNTWWDPWQVDNIAVWVQLMHLHSGIHRHLYAPQMLEGWAKLDFRLKIQISSFAHPSHIFDDEFLLMQPHAPRRFSTVTSRRQLVPFFSTISISNISTNISMWILVDTFVEMFEMEIVEKKGTSCRRLCRTHKMMIAWRCVRRNHKMVIAWLYACRSWTVELTTWVTRWW